MVIIRVITIIRTRAIIFFISNNSSCGCQLVNKIKTTDMQQLK